MPLKSFLETLERMKEIHNSKSQDYADPNNPLSNFDVSEYGISLFNSDRDKVFVSIIFNKFSRLSTLLNSGNTPNNESIEDSFVDIANYVILWKCDVMGRNKDTSEGILASEQLLLSNEVLNREKEIMRIAKEHLKS